MKDTGLRTICSVSGTTRDIVAGLVAHMGQDKVQPMLNSLKEFVNAGCPKPPKGPQLSDEFKELFLGIAIYLQAGQYHSEGEVLTGLYTSALTLTGDPNVKNFDAIAPNFQKMWEALRDRSEDFYPLKDKDKKSLIETVPQIVSNLQTQHMGRIRTRHDLEIEDAVRKEQRRSNFEKEEFKEKEKSVLPPKPPRPRAKDSIDIDK